MPVDGKLMQLRATQMNLLRLRGIDFKTVLGIYGKFEKGIPVSAEETALYENAIGILVQNNAADSYLSQYSRALQEKQVTPKTTSPVEVPRKEKPAHQARSVEAKKPEASTSAGAPAFVLKPNFGVTRRTVIVGLILILILALAWSLGSGDKKKPPVKQPVKAGTQQTGTARSPQK